MPNAPVSPPAAAFWRRRLVDPIARQLTQGVSPEKIALTLAAGGAAALFPILGTTTFLCLLLGVVFKLNQPILQGINVLAACVYLPVAIGCIRLGELLSGQSPTRPDLAAMWAMFRHHPTEFLHRFGMTAVHAIYGWAAAAPFWIATVYLVSLPALRALGRRVRRRRMGAPRAS